MYFAISTNYFAPGTYNFTLIVEDELGNTAFSTVTHTIEEEVTPTPTPTPTPTTTPTTPIIPTTINYSSIAIVMLVLFGVAGIIRITKRNKR